MANFFKFLLASCLGTFLAIGGLVLVGVISITRLAAAFEDQDVSVEANTVLVLRPGTLPELRDNIQQAAFSFEDKHIYGLRDMTRALALAAEDDDIKGIYLDVDNARLAPASATTLRDAVQRFRESGKFVVSHALNYGQGGYYLASAADAVYLNPTGSVDVRGYGATLPFFKDALDKIGVNINVFYAGDFKSAGEPFFRNGISDSNRLQTRIYLEDLWRIYTEEVAETRGISAGTINALAEDFTVRDDSAALAARLIDGILYKDQVLDNIRERLGLDADDEINTVTMEDYATRLKPENVRSDDKIAIVYAEGNIVDGEDQPGTISGEAYTRLFREIRQDDEVKAIVVRINSGGGSAMASENIWREIQLARDQGIPVVTSMGDVAASGGYYMAVASDSIFALPNTITGSIGVIGIVPNFSPLMNDKLGVHFDTVNTGRYSSAFSTVIPFTAQEKAFIQESITDIYQHFISRVAAGRNLPVETVARLAKGRVYTGEDALAIGLVDRLGDLDAAINAAARMANLDASDARIAEYPKVANALEQLIAEVSGTDPDERKIKLLAPLLKREFGGDWAEINRAQQLIQARGPQMLMLETLHVR